MSDTPLYGIIGHPLGHTMSPPLHNWALGQAGLPGRYEAWPTQPDQVPAFMARMRTGAVSGASVTIPHKPAVMEHLDSVTGTAKAVGAVNTLYWDGDVLAGHNTDVEGFAHPLLEMSLPPSSALVLGAGGAARAVMAGLSRAGIERVVVANRSAHKALALAMEFGAEGVAWDDRALVNAELVVNTTPMGMAGTLVNASPMPDDYCLSPNQVVYDIVYNPLRTRLLRQAEDCGCRTIDGLSMFIHQAQGQFRLWTGREFDPTGARRLLMTLLS